MTLTIRSKNSKANAALGGFAGSFAQGIGIGQRQQVIDQQAQEDAFRQEQALRQASRVDAELQREAVERAAGQQAAASLVGEGDPLQGQPPSGAQAGAAIGAGVGGGMGGAVAGGMLGAQDQQAIDRVKAIASHMEPKAAAMFVQAANEKHRQLVDDRERKQLTDQVSRGTAAGSYFTQQPDGTRTSTPAVDKALQQFSEAAADKNTPPATLRMLKANLDREQIIAKSTFERVQRTMGDLRTRIDQAAQPSTPGPQTATDFAASSAKTGKLQMMASAYEHLAPQLMADPKAFREFEAKFWPEFAQTEAGIAFQDKDYGPVSFAAADQFMRLKQESEQWKAQASQAQAALNAAKQSQLPQQLENDTTRAQAAKTAAERPRQATPGSGPQRPPSDEDLYQKAQKAVLDRAGDKTFTDEQLDAETLKEMGRIKSAVRGFKAKAEGAQSGETKISVDQAVQQGWTEDEWDSYSKTGKMPKPK